MSARLSKARSIALALIATLGPGCERAATERPASTPDARGASAARAALPPGEAVDPQAIVTPLVRIEAGTFRPLFGKDTGDTAVSAFDLERHAVTNAQFLAFVRAEPAWRRSHVARLFADAQYLAPWRDDLDPGPDAGARPVTHVSWFAARAYARWAGRRLPTVAEWEVAAADLEGGKAAVTERLLAWYARPTPDVLPEVESTFATRAGVFDLHGLVWEWVEDFNSALVSGESRGDAGLERNLFCGSGSVGATDPADYAAFMRYAFRSSLRAGYTVRTLGFRCAADVAPPVAADVAEESCCSDEPAAKAPLPEASVYALGSTWTDQSGVVRRLADFRGHVTLVAMVFTHCSYVCPRLTADAKALVAALPEAQRGAVRGLLVSFDTVRDQPERLREWAGEQGLDLTQWTLLHGDAGAVRELAAVLGVNYQQAPNGDFAHSNLITVLDREGRIAHRVQGLQVDKAPVVAAISALLR